MWAWRGWGRGNTCVVSATVGGGGASELGVVVSRGDEGRRDDDEDWGEGTDGVDGDAVVVDEGTVGIEGSVGGGTIDRKSALGGTWLDESCRV